MREVSEKKVKGKIFVVDDEERICDAVKRALERVGYQVETSLDAMDALEKIHKCSWDMVICDVRMPEMDGTLLLDRIKEYDSNILVLMITGYASIESAVEAVKRGAQEYIPKPFSPEQLRFFVERAFERRRLMEENLHLKTELGQVHVRNVVIGKSQVMEQLFGLVAKVAKTDSSVLITGESGSGKEIVARLIHFGGARADAPFVTVNCSAIPRDLLESELFRAQTRGFYGGYRYQARKL